MRNERTFPPPHPLGRAPKSPVYGIVGLPFVSLSGRNCRFRSDHLGCSGRGLASSLGCLDAPMVLLTMYLVQDGSTGLLRIKAWRTVERKEISLFKNGKPSYRRKRRNTVDHLVVSVIYYGRKSTSTLKICCGHCYRKEKERTRRTKIMQFIIATFDETKSCTIMQYIYDVKHLINYTKSIIT